MPARFKISLNRSSLPLLRFFLSLTLLFAASSLTGEQGYFFSSIPEESRNSHVFEDIMNFEIVSDSEIEMKYEAEYYIQRANEIKLYDDQYWLLIGHYQKQSFGRMRSEARPPFFLSEQGWRNPAAEMEATLHGIFQPLDAFENPDEHPQCRFPLRTQFFKAALDIPDTVLPDPECQAYNRMREITDTESISLVFASYYMNAPASMFGHTLLKLNKRDNDVDLLNHAVNYAADPGDIGGFRFALYGLTGGFPGSFSLMPYHIKVQEYNDLDSRDMWEYKLNLSEEEIERIMQHLWELGPVQFPYFYIRQNCSYHLLTLIEVARPGLDLRSNFRGWIIPGETVKAILEALKNDSNSISFSRIEEMSDLTEEIADESPGTENGFSHVERKVRPSLQSQIYSKLYSMNSEERSAVYSLTGSRNDTITENINTLSSFAEDRQALIVDTALSAFRLKAQSTADRPTDVQQNLLMYRAELNAGYEDPPSFEMSAPEEGHDLRMLRMAGGVESRGSFAEFQFRPGFHDLLNREAGFAPDSEIEFFSANIRYSEDPDTPWHLQKSSLARAVSLNPYDRILFSGSYLIDIGTDTIYMPERMYRAGTKNNIDTETILLASIPALQDLPESLYLADHYRQIQERQNTVSPALVYNAEFMYGYSYRRFGSPDNLLISLLFGGSLRYMPSFDRHEHPAAQMQIGLMQGYDKFKWHLTGTLYSYRDLGADHKVSLSMRYILGHNHEVRLTASDRRHQEEALLSYIYFF